MYFVPRSPILLSTDIVVVCAQDYLLQFATDTAVIYVFEQLCYAGSAEIVYAYIQYFQIRQYTADCTDIDIDIGYMVIGWIMYTDTQGEGGYWEVLVF